MERSSQRRIMRRVIGVDPGSVRTGYGVVESDGYVVNHIGHGCIRTVKSGEDIPFPDRIGRIYSQLSEILLTWKPDAASIEGVFVGKNPSSSLKLGQARGAAISALTNYGLSVTEYAPKLVKQTVSGRGTADKSELQIIVRAMLSIQEQIQEDAGDALAIAICGARSLTSSQNTQLIRPKNFRGTRSGRGLRIRDASQLRKNPGV